MRANTNFAIQKFSLQLDSFEDEGVPTLAMSAPYAVTFVNGRDFAQQASASSDLRNAPVALIAREGCEG